MSAPVQNVPLTVPGFSRTVKTSIAVDKSITCVGMPATNVPACSVTNVPIQKGSSVTNVPTQVDCSMAYLPTQSVCSVIAPVQTTASMIVPSQTVSSVNEFTLTVTMATMPDQTTMTSSGSSYCTIW